MKIVVTGGAGFIGSKVAERLLARGCQILVVDNLVTGSKANIPTGARFEHMAAENPKLAAAIEAFAPDTIAHIGGQSSGEIGELQPLDDQSWNVASTLNLLTIASRIGVNRFVYASSMGVYGLADGGANGLREQDSGLPISIYGAGKHCSEQYLRLFAQRNITCVSLRMFNVYGPGQDMNNSMQGMVSIYISSLLKTGKVVVRGSLDRIRDFVFIDDVVDAWEKALFANLSEPFIALNVGSGKGTSVKGLLKSIKTCVGDFSVEVADPTPADQNATIADVSNAKHVLQWEPKTDLEQGLQQLLAWARQK